MSKRKTPGERFRAKADPLFSPHITNYDDFERLMDWLEKSHDAAIRRAEQRKAEAVWDEGYVEGQMGGTPRNPYRKVKR